jgi:hypothetical protein
MITASGQVISIRGELNAANNAGMLKAMQLFNR